MPGFFISFEGSEGCGKSTQIAMLAARLRHAGFPPVMTREPGGTCIGEKIRHLLQHDPEAANMAPETELLLFAASRAQLVREVIGPALDAGHIVIADRFLDSTTVYQGVARALPMEAVEAINRFAAGSRLPDLTFVLDMDASRALARARKISATHDAGDRMENEPAAFYEVVREGYRALARREPRRVRLLDAARAPETIFREILEILQSTGHAAFQRLGV